MVQNAYPKVLLLGHQFDNKTGLGITLANLFANWPKEKIAIMAPLINVSVCEETHPCNTYIGASYDPSKRLNRGSVKNRIRRSIRKVYYYIGLNEKKYAFPFNEKEILEAQLFEPDIIFSCLGSYNSMRTCQTIMGHFPNAKLVLYIVDDWVNTKENNRLFSSYWRKKNDTLFRSLLDLSSGLLSICPFMSEVYKEKYGKVFLPFHNPVDYDSWQALPQRKKYNTDVKSLLYVGKINGDTRHCLLDVASAVESLNKSQSCQYILDVFTPDYTVNQSLFGAYSSCHVFPAVPHHEIPFLMKGYDALLLTLGFSKSTEEYVRLSMPTKVSEYLASGVPIVLYCPETIALAKYLKPFNCTINCFVRDRKLLAQYISKLKNEDYCRALISDSLLIAKNHDSVLVRASFEKVLFSLIYN